MNGAVGGSSAMFMFHVIGIGSTGITGIVPYSMVGMVLNTGGVLNDRGREIRDEDASDIGYR